MSRGILLIFAAYFYFLIFAQFAFLEMGRIAFGGEERLRVLMGAMAVGGLMGSVAVPLAAKRFGLSRLMRIGLIGCAATGLAAVAPARTLLFFAAAIGNSLGIVTVSLAAGLARYFTAANWSYGAALGTGLAYAAANLPFVFRGTPQFQSAVAAMIAFLSLFAVARRGESDERDSSPAQGFSPVFAALLFGALVWFDSAAFYIIQHSDLKQGTWSHAPNLWRNALVHFSAAIVGGIAVKQAGFRLALAASFAILSISALAANHPDTRWFAGWLYPAGVSLYSMCLVAYPAFGSGARGRTAIAWQSALLYAFSGWICSGLGIGMAQDLHRIPWQFVAVTLAVVAAPACFRFLLRQRAELAFAAAIAGAAALWTFDAKPAATSGEQLALGRAVYIAEGCINCHSQFVRPDSRDELIWGAPHSAEGLRADAPPLFGNRRQGPDLLNIGDRRSANWLREHFISPRALAAGTPMPSYAHLFSDNRGPALVAYLSSLHSTTGNTSRAWEATPPETENRERGENLFVQTCAACHGLRDGLPGAVPAKLRNSPPNLSRGPFLFAPTSLPHDIRLKQLANIVKFGLTGTDMPGHEYFSDGDVFALAAYIEHSSRSDKHESPGR